MDILRKELNAIYEAQRLGESRLPAEELTRCRRLAESVALAGNGCTALTDASCDRCYLYAGATGAMLGLADTYPLRLELESSDEDIVYNRIHPEDLVDKRMLEYEYFRMVDPLPAEEKLRHKATCRFRIRDRRGEYVAVDNSTQVIAVSPEERIWLILCTYQLSPYKVASDGMSPCITDTLTGEIRHLSFAARRSELITPREKEILLMIRDGKLSKEIAAKLGISLHTVNRHRQNILEKLSVDNSIEAIMAATSMKLL